MRLADFIVGMIAGGLIGYGIAALFMG